MQEVMLAAGEVMLVAEEVELLLATTKSGYCPLDLPRPSHIPSCHEQGV